MLNARRKLYSANNMLEAARKDTERLDRVLDKLGIDNPIIQTSAPIEDKKADVAIDMVPAVSLNKNFDFK